MNRNPLTRVICFLLIFLIPLSACSNEDIKKAPLSIFDCTGKNYQEVATAFENAGFENVQLVADPDLVFGWLAKEYEVSSVSIDGKTLFNAGDQFSKSAEIVITYHTYPAEETQEPEPTEPKETIFTQLTDAQFSTLTEAVSVSFYTFTLPTEVQAKLATDTQVMQCLTQIYDYAYANQFALDPDFKAACSAKSELIQALPCFETLQKNFLVNLYRDSANNQWVLDLDAYSLNPSDLLEVDGTLYVDAEGYLQKGVVLFWQEEGKMQAAGEILDVAYNKEVSSTLYAYAVNVEYYDDPHSSGWTDGEILLTMNKKLSGKPLYYVNVLDENRSLQKEYIDYTSPVSWKPLDASNCKDGADVYSGITQAKSYIFTIVKVDAAKDRMTVRYPSGSVEIKCYSSMLNLGYLYVK